MNLVGPSSCNKNILKDAACAMVSVSSGVDFEACGKLRFSIEIEFKVSN
jgi:hypothetical protein